jgi:hypothetical protein
VVFFTHQALDIEKHLNKARSMVRAIMHASEEITIDGRDNMMLTELTIAIDDEFDAIAKVLGLHA